ncbi:MAG: hypothetical protein P1P88_25215, partial [Bacteroidales bacterium]|nr:hypothetical protein [Bacteroidales bacterium]
NVSGLITCRFGKKNFFPGVYVAEIEKKSVAGPNTSRIWRKIIFPAQKRGVNKRKKCFPGIYAA